MGTGHGVEDDAGLDEINVLAQDDNNNNNAAAAAGGAYHPLLRRLPYCSTPSWQCPYPMPPEAQACLAKFDISGMGRTVEEPFIYVGATGLQDLVDTFAEGLYQKYNIDYSSPMGPETQAGPNPLISVSVVECASNGSVGPQYGRANHNHCFLRVGLRLRSLC